MIANDQVRKTIMTVKIWNRALLLVLALGVLTACAENDVAPEEAQAAPTVTPIPPPPVAERPTVTVERGVVEDRLEFTAQWLPRDQQALSFEINGSIRSVNVARGDSVQAGELLADYQIQELEDQLDSALLDLEAAERRLATGGEGGTDAVLNAQFGVADANIGLESTLNNVPWTTVANARQSLDDAQRNLEQAQMDYDEARSDPSAPASSVDSAYRNLLNAQSQLESAQNSYYSAAQSYNDYQNTIDRSRNSQLRAEIELQNAIEGSGVDQDLIDAVRNAQLRVDQIRADIAQSSLFAPFDGIVLEVTVRPGDQVQAFNSVITMALPQPREASATLSFNDVQSLDIGKQGVCQVANQPDTRVACVVRSRPFTSQEADQTVRVAADFIEALQLGQLIEIEMPLQTREDVLWLPPRAIRTFQNRTFVIIRTDAGEQVVDIQLGLQTDDRVEIVSDALEEGDQVVLP
jgi:multidrug efflux pump subunit AcrA (membrane-fusion protein)